MNALRNKLMLTGAVLAIGTGSLAAPAMAKHGSDDPARHEARDDHGGQRAHAARHHHGHRGHDDRPGDDHGTR
jgi:hypothetical protein